MSELRQQFFDHQDDLSKAIVHTTQDVEPYIEYAKRMRNDEEYTRQGIKNNFWHVGTLPMVIVHRWHKEGFDLSKADTKSLLAKIASDPEAQAYLTTNKRIG